MASYDPAIVTFLDVLGFRELVSTADANIVNSKLEAVERFTRPTLPPDDDPEESYEPIVLQFSDAIVRIRRIHTKPNRQRPIGMVFHELLDLVHAQGELIREGVLIRGGVSYGRVFTSKGRVFGPALVTAYELESKVALYPRIVIEPALLSEFKNNVLLKAAHHDLEEEMEYVNDLVRRGDDGIWFVDYLKAIESELDDPSMYPDVFRTHRKLILDGAKRFKGLSSPMSKYLWLAAYHNELVSELPSKWLRYYELKKRDLAISPKDFPALEELPSKLTMHLTRPKRRAGDRKC